MPKTAFDASRFSGFWFKPEELILVTDPADPLYDARVHLEPTEPLILDLMYRGIVDPVLITRRNTSPVVVNGRQRTKAAVEANKRLTAVGREPIKVPCFLRGGEDADLFGVLIASNEHRLNDGPLERARKAQKLMNFGRSVEEVATTFGVSASAITKWLKIFDLPKDVRDRIEAGQLSVEAALQLHDLPPAQASAVAAKAGEAAAQVTERAAAAQVAEQAKPAPAVVFDPHGGGGKKVGVKPRKEKKEKLKRAPRQPTAKQTQRAAQKAAAQVIADEVGVAAPRMKSRKQIEDRLNGVEKGSERMPADYRLALQWVLGLLDRPTPAQGV